MPAAPPTATFVYLASRSPRRQALLEQVGITYRMLTPEAHEDAEALEQLCAGETAAAYVQRVARAKAQAARERLLRIGAEPAPILAADTTVAIGASLLAKPTDIADARRMLTLLSGRTHRVLTAVAVARGRSGIESRLSVSRVTFARITRAEIDHYVASGEPMDKAGAYAIQGGAARFVRRIEGSYTGIMGLPLYETVQLLRTAGTMRA